MKITKRRLRRIIKEALTEAHPPGIGGYRLDSDADRYDYHNPREPRTERDPATLTHSQYSPEESNAYQRGVDDTLDGLYEPGDIDPALLPFYEAGIEAGQEEYDT